MSVPLLRWPCRWALSLLLVAVAVPVPARSQRAGGAAGPWSPPQEPAAWSAVRTSLLKKGPPGGLIRREWIFLRALERDDLRAGEYLADLRPAGDGTGALVIFHAVVVMQRAGQAWMVRERRMRARCAERSLEVQDSAGAWVTYAGTQDAEAPRRVAWICERAATP